MPRRLSRLPMFALAAALPLAGPVAAATLPLQDGDYTSGACSSGHSDITESIGLYTLDSGPQRGVRFLSPNAETQDGYCNLGKLVVTGDRFSGSPKCRSGAKVDYPTGTYRFTYTVIDPRTFVSRGKTYRWCADHR